MRLFLDTNVVLDLLGKRNPFYNSIAKVATLADKKELRIIASPITFTTVSYILNRHEPAGIVAEKLRKFKIICEIGLVDEHVIEKALNSNFNDFEDAVQYYCAIESECQIIITRNGKDFKESDIPFMTADEYLSSR